MGTVETFVRQAWPLSEPDVSSSSMLGFIFRQKTFYQTAFFFSPCYLSGKQFLIVRIETASLVAGESSCFLVDESPKVEWGIRILSSRSAVHEANGTSDLHDIDCASRCARRTRIRDVAFFVLYQAVQLGRCVVTAPRDLVM
jgi:hypothetical protein